MNLRELCTRSLALAVMCLLATGAAAACLDPHDLPKAYKPTLDQEIKASSAVVVGKVVHTKTLREDKADPDGWTAFIYTIQVVEALKGKVAHRFDLRAENDSGGYRMNDGETHLLFLSSQKDSLRVDPCGNSSELPKGSETLNRLRASPEIRNHVG
jgi:hypothetical protein